MLGRQAPVGARHAAARHLAGDLGPDRADAARRRRDGRRRPGRRTSRCCSSARGFAEEAYFTYSFSPIRDDGGRGRRRLHGGARDEPRACSGRAGWRRSPRSARRSPTRARSRRSPPAALAALARAPRGRPVRGAVRDRRGRQRALRGRLRAPSDRTGAEAAAATAAGERVARGPAAPSCCPSPGPGSTVPAAALVLGASPRHHLDEGYRDFFRMIARQLSAALSSAAGPGRRADARRRAGGARPRQDRVLLQRLARVPHAADADARPARRRARRPRPDPAAQRERIEVAQRGALRLLRLVNALLDLSRIEAGRVVAGFAPVDLGRLARDSAAAFAVGRRALRAGARARRRPRTGPTIEADADMVEKILLNLLSNAYKFTLRGPDRAARARRRAGRARGRRQRRRHPRGRAAAAVRALPPRPRRARPQPRGQRHRARARPRARRASTAARCPSRAPPAQGSTFRIELPARQPGAHAAAGTDARPRRTRSATASARRPLRWMAGRADRPRRADDGPAGGARRRRQRRPAPVPHPAAGGRVRRPHRRRRRRRARADRRAPARPRADRRDDAGRRRLRAAREAARRTRARSACR